MSLESDKACPCDVMEVDGVEDKAGFVISNGDVNMNKKGKGKEIATDLDVLVNDASNFQSIAGFAGNVNCSGSNSDLSCHDDGNNDDNDGGDADDVFDDEENEDDMYDYNDDDDDYDYGDYDNYDNLQAQFDNVDVPPGVEVSVPWLTSSVPCAPSSSTLPSLQTQSSENLATTCNTASEVSSSDEKSSTNEEVMRKFRLFKRFDTVGDFSDHHFDNTGFGTKELPSKDWIRKIQEEWKILEKDLPETIYVRASEGRMDLLRAAIVGPAGTPYHDGLFFFDIHFPSSYPSVPPMVYYYSGGLRLNPNLYACGKVCLSLLNTWDGKKTEKWLPDKSTMLQVLVSIQALILNDEPFFNEPGYDKRYRGSEGERKSKEYNQDVFILSLKTMMYAMRKPPEHFEDLVAGHFRERAQTILMACEAYVNGVATVGSVINRVENVGGAEKNEQTVFRANLAKVMSMLIASFRKNGSVP